MAAVNNGEFTLLFRFVPKGPSAIESDMHMATLYFKLHEKTFLTFKTVHINTRKYKNQPIFPNSSYAARRHFQKQFKNKTLHYTKINHTLNTGTKYKDNGIHSNLESTSESFRGANALQLDRGSVRSVGSLTLPPWLLHACVLAGCNCWPNKCVTFVIKKKCVTSDVLFIKSSNGLGT